MSEFQQRTLRKSPLTWENQNSPIFQRVGGWATQSNKYESKHESSAFRKKKLALSKGVPTGNNQFRRPVLVGVSSCLCNLNEHIFVYIYIYTHSLGPGKSVAAYVGGTNSCCNFVRMFFIGKHPSDWLSPLLFLVRAYLWWRNQQMIQWWDP